jgi:hypothetical protein
MGDGFLEGRAAQGLVAGFAPPLDGEVIKTSQCEMMSDDFGRGCRPLGLIAEKFTRASQAVEGRRDDKRVRSIR